MSEDTGQPAAPPPEGQPPPEGDGFEVPIGRRRRMDAAPKGTSPAVVVALVTAAAAIVALVMVMMKDTGIYSKPIDQLVHNQLKYAHRPVRAEGTLVHGTLVKREKPCEYRFTITSNGVDVPVRYPQCVVPDTFRDVPGMDVNVTVEGQLKADGSFEATSVLAKCPSKYEMKQKAAHGEKMPHAALDQSTPGY